MCLMDNGQIILFQTQGGETKIEVRLSNETVWLTADQMAELSAINQLFQGILRMFLSQGNLIQMW